MKLTEENYHSNEANRAYWSVSQFKSFLTCQDRAVGELIGVYHRPETEALLVGNYVDAHFSGTGKEFLDEHPELVNSRTGEMKAFVKKALKGIDRAEYEPMFMEFMDGEKQVILTGKLFEKDWKVKVDVLHTDKIVDLKYMKDTKPMFVAGERKTFIDAWGYDLQGYVYQQIVEQATGKHLPFYLAVITKEEHPEVDIIHIPDWKLNSAGELIKHYLPEFEKVKNLEVLPSACGECDWCRDTKTIEKVTEYEELLERI